MGAEANNQHVMRHALLGSIITALHLPQNITSSCCSSDYKSALQLVFCVVV